jgi:hypothetical protein
MKKILFLILTSILLFASNVVKDKNETYGVEYFKKYIIGKFNYIMPSFLQVQPMDNFFSFSAGYDTLNKKFTQSLSINVYIPRLQKKVTKTKIKKRKKRIIKTEIKFKFLPLLRLYHRIPTVVFKTSLTYSKKNENSFKVISKKFSINESVYIYPFFKFLTESTTIQFHRFLSINNLVYSITRSYNTQDKGNMGYSTGVYFYNGIISKFIRTYGFTMGGSTHNKPVIYYYKLFFNYRHILFNKKYYFITLTPYLLFSKDYDYNPKAAISASFNIKF